MYLAQPQFVSPELKFGTVKFFIKDENYGFITVDDVDAFTHRLWLRKPSMHVDGFRFSVKLSECDEHIKPEQHVFCSLRYNKARDKHEAHDVVDAYAMQMVMYEINRAMGRYKKWVEEQPVYRVHWITDIMGLKADNKLKKYVDVKIGENTKIVFEGNDQAEMNKITKVLTEGRLKYEIKHPQRGWVQTSTRRSA